MQRSSEIRKYEITRPSQYLKCPNCLDSELRSKVQVCYSQPKLYVLACELVSKSYLMYEMFLLPSLWGTVRNNLYKV